MFDVRVISTVNKTTNVVSTAASTARVADRISLKLVMSIGGPPRYLSDMTLWFPPPAPYFPKSRRFYYRQASLMSSLMIQLRQNVHRGLRQVRAFSVRCGFGPFLPRWQFGTRNRIRAHSRVFVAEMYYRDPRSGCVCNSSSERCQ